MMGRQTKPGGIEACRSYSLRPLERRKRKAACLARERVKEVTTKRRRLPAKQASSAHRGISKKVKMTTSNKKDGNRNTAIAKKTSLGGRNGKKNGVQPLLAKRKRHAQDDGKKKDKVMRNSDDKTRINVRNSKSRAWKQSNKNKAICKKDGKEYHEKLKAIRDANAARMRKKRASLTPQERLVVRRRNTKRIRKLRAQMTLQQKRAVLDANAARMRRVRAALREGKRKDGVRQKRTQSSSAVRKRTATKNVKRRKSTNTQRQKSVATAKKKSSLDRPARKFFELDTTSDKEMRKPNCQPAKQTGLNNTAEWELLKQKTEASWPIPEGPEVQQAAVAAAELGAVVANEPSTSKIVGNDEKNDSVVLKMIMECWAMKL